VRTRPSESRRRGVPGEADVELSLMFLLLFLLLRRPQERSAPPTPTPCAEEDEPAPSRPAEEPEQRTSFPTDAEAPPPAVGTSAPVLPPVASGGPAAPGATVPPLQVFAALLPGRPELPEAREAPPSDPAPPARSEVERLLLDASPEGLYILMDASSVCGRPPAAPPLTGPPGPSWRPRCSPRYEGSPAGMEPPLWSRAHWLVSLPRACRTSLRQKASWWC